MNPVLSFLMSHWVTIALGTGYVSLAFVNNLPKPGSQITKYEYLYNVVQTLTNSPVIKHLEQKIPNLPIEEKK